MKALIAAPQTTGLVELADVAEPEPTPNEALVQVAAFSINRGETFLLENPPHRWRPGKDIAGIVTRAAADGTGPAAGTRVVGHPASAGWAERVAIPTSQLAELPTDVPLTTAAALPLAGLTALRLIRTAGSLAGARVLLTGASGGVGHYVVELAAAHGAQITAVTASPDRGQRLLELGATQVVTDLSDADGCFDVAIESVGGGTTRQAWHALHQHGLLLWLGQASKQPPELDFFDWTGATSVTIRKFDYTDSPYSDATDLATLTRLVAQRHLHPEIGLTTDWTNTSDAIGRLLDRRLRGNAVLTIGDSYKS